MLRLYVTSMFLFIKHSYLLSAYGIILNQLCMILVAVQFDNEYTLSSGTQLMLVK